MKQGSITQIQFRKLEFPNLPYCAFNLRARLGDGSYHYHYKNSSTNVQLNVYWNKSDETVTISRYDPQTENVKNILERNDEFNQQILNEICKKYLG